MKTSFAALLIGSLGTLGALPFLEGTPVATVRAATAPAVARSAAPPSAASAASTSAINAAPAATVTRGRTARALLATSLAPAAGLAPRVLDLAMSAIRCAATSGDIEPPPTLTVIDYSLPSTEPRLWVYDLASGTLLFRELVAHGRNTGDNLAERFSDTPDSRQSSLGLFVTADTYVGSNGYSLRLDGLEPGFNSHARERAIVMHGAPYVDATHAALYGRLGRSWGCPALRAAIARDVIDTIRGGGVIFSYYPDETWLKASRYLNCHS